MGVGEFLSSKATNEWILSERRREEWEMENYPDGEIREVSPSSSPSQFSRDAVPFHGSNCSAFLR